MLYFFKPKRVEVLQRNAFILLVSLLSFFSLHTYAQDSYTQEKAEEYLVVFKPELLTTADYKQKQIKQFKSGETISQAAHRVIDETNSYYGQVDNAVKKVYKRAIDGFLAKLTPEAVSYLNQHPQILEVAANESLSLDAGLPPLQIQETSLNWLDRIDDREFILDGTYEYVYDGTGVNAYILDDGGRNPNAINFVSPEEDQQNRQRFPDCSANHGIAVETALKGVAPGTNVNHLRLTSCGQLSISGLVSAVDWLLENVSLPAVINMSFSQTTSSTVIDNAVRRLADAGLFVAVSAGNRPQDACLATPARLPEVMTVGWSFFSNQQDSVAPRASYGPCVDIFAVGSSITVRSLPIPSLNGSEIDITQEGSSFSTPLVAGIAARLFDQFPHLTAAQIRNRIINAATPDLLAPSDAMIAANAVNSTPNLLAYHHEVNLLPPPYPTELAASYSRADGRITFSWNAPEDQPAPLSRYEIVASPDKRDANNVGAPGFGGGVIENITTDASLLSRSFLSESTTTWRFRIRACYPTECSPWVWLTNITANDVTDASSALGLLNESGANGWSDDFGFWRRGSGSTLTVSTGPSGASSGDFYFYIETSVDGNNENGSAIPFTSPGFTVNGGSLSFDYHMYGANTGSLFFQIFDGYWRTLWVRSGQQQASSTAPWQTATISLSDYSGPVQVRFIHVATGGEQGDIAIDNVVYTP